MSALELEAPAAAPEVKAADAALDAAWDAYARWDTAAISRKRGLDWSRGLSLFCSSALP